MTKPLLLQVLITAQFLIEYNEGLTTFAFSGETVHPHFVSIRYGTQELELQASFVLINYYKSQ